ncbi:MAG: hypothetical protein R3B90_21825 [Planctomycetaceae bacterium]
MAKRRGDYRLTDAVELVERHGFGVVSLGYDARAENRVVRVVQQFSRAGRSMSRLRRPADRSAGR